MKKVKFIKDWKNPLGTSKTTKKTYKTQKKRKKMLEDENKSLEKKKNQASLDEPLRHGSISQTCNLLNSRPRLNPEAQHLTN